MPPQKPPSEPPKRGRPRTATAMTAAQRMRRMRERRKGIGLHAVTRWEPRQPTIAAYSTHRLIEARSLAMHAAVARKIERDPALLAVPRRNLERWAQRWSDQPPSWLHEWRALLQRPWPEIAAIITEPSENGARLRQSSPFAGVLTPGERARIYAAFAP
jgi:hypothetical protein